MQTVDEQMTPRQLTRPRVATNLRRARLDRELSQKQLAGDIGVEREQISEWEVGRHEPSARYIELLAEALRVPAHYFQSGTGLGA